MIPWFQYTTINIGPIPIQVWGSFVALGMVVASLIITKRGKRLGLQTEALLDGVVWMIILGVVVARLFHVFLYEPAYFLQNPMDFFKIWHGGLSSFGGLVGAALGFAWMLKKHPVLKQHPLKSADTLSFAALFGWIIGRIGCVMIHDHLGKPCDCFLAIQTPDGTARLDMAFLEIIGLLPLAILFLLFRKKKLPKGWFTGVLFAYYGILRFILDFWRADPSYPTGDARYLGLTPAQYFAILLALAGGYLLYKMRKPSV